MRPRSLDEFVGQEHILRKEGLLLRSILYDKVSSLIFYGPPGTGKSALAHIIKEITDSNFESLNAVTSQVKDLRRVIQKAEHLMKTQGGKTILFIDEIHRYNRIQQDALLPSLEEGTIRLIGTTTHNPFFYITPPLLSRTQIYEFHPLSKEDLLKIMSCALHDKERGLGWVEIEIAQDAIEYIASGAGGDARRALNALELAALTSTKKKNGKVYIDMEVASDALQKRPLYYDREDEHYDTISAFIKSMRGSDPDATLYWLAKMIKAGEDPRFIARRIIVAASEDVGNANPHALVVAEAALGAVELVGHPEAMIPLAQAALYVATSPKSNAVYLGIKRAIEDIEKRGPLQVPKHLCDASYKGAKRLGHGKGYLYPHNYPHHYVKQSYLPEEVIYYEPTSQGYEKKIKEYLERLRDEGKDKKGVS